MRLSDAGLHRRQTKALYPNHRLPPWPNEERDPRSLEPIVRGQRHVEPWVVEHRNPPALQLSPTTYIFFPCNGVAQLPSQRLVRTEELKVRIPCCSESARQLLAVSASRIVRHLQRRDPHTL